MKITVGIIGVALAVVTTPASAAVVVLASDVNFAGAPYTFGVNDTDTFTFTYDPRGMFDPSPVLVRTSGSAAVTTVLGNPSVSFPRASVTFGPNSFPGFSSVPTDTRASFTLTLSDLGLRYTAGGNDFYGYARFAGPNITRIAFESSPNTAIVAGSVAAVPEPATWAMMLVGFGMIGGSARYRRRRRSFLYA